MSAGVEGGVDCGPAIRVSMHAGVPVGFGDVEELYHRFEIARPEYLADDHWRGIEQEADRMRRSLEAGDGSQVLSDVKCLVESIARIVLEIDGMPADPNGSFDSIVAKAHHLLAGTPGYELANQSPFGQVATQASKIARNLAAIRNGYGGGHGSARPPDLRDEMVNLTLDGGLLWARWALRRLGYFSEGRPSRLIDDLIGESKTFYAGVLQRRLLAANLPLLESRHQRSIGVAVGQRVMRGTFVVRWDGLDPCLESDDLATWPRHYRIGLAYGLWFDPNGQITLTTQSLRDALQVLEPVPDCADDLTDWAERVKKARPPGTLSADWNEAHDAERLVRDRIKLRPAEEGTALSILADHIKPDPPF